MTMITLCPANASLLKQTGQNNLTKKLYTTRDKPKMFIETFKIEFEESANVLTIDFISTLENVSFWVDTKQNS